MDKKWLSIISYITIIGWVISYVLYNNEPIKSPLVRFHLKQALGLAVLSILISIASWIIVPIIPAIGIVFLIINIIQVILWILGIINAANEREKPVPLVGGLFVNQFDFIK